MDCPKCRSELVNGILSDLLLTKHCRECAGDWISGHNYQVWRSQRPHTPSNPAVLAQNYHLPYNPSPLDAKTAPCPDCARMMARGKISLKQPFYLEHCLTCGGIWCDRGEWAVLEQLKLDTNIAQIFSSVWQAQVRASHLHELERQAVIDKVGVEMAQRVFDLTDLLTKHPNGDFAAAYLMRQFERTRL
ncbi:zf-TFIIB domain-containing protein [Chamaesiphon sp.]|uniref:TFIIB-type zinc ribbon-containing protein n=1 Tax=Chamaesiphon sp. TaxID=2814140 RepID=UPI0035932960